MTENTTERQRVAALALLEAAVAERPGIPVEVAKALRDALFDLRAVLVMGEGWE